MRLPIVSIYAALLFVMLSVRTLRLRGRLRIAIGDAGNEPMLRAMRVHSNFAEYVPLGLLLIALVELGQAPSLLVHALGLLLLGGRIVHAWGVSRSPENFRFRIVGMALTFATLLLAALYLLYAALVRSLY